MIDISHKQAQYLLRVAEDKRLPEEQWTALQNHLERCESCRAYRDHRARVARGIHHLMDLRWRHMAGPSAAMAGSVAASRQQRKLHTRRAVYLTLGALVLVALAVLGRLNKIPFLAAAPRPMMTSTPLPTIAPTPAERFRGVVVFASGQGGNNDIYLLNATGSDTPELTNLTQYPADDTAPIWSPDGEWIAFLSNRAQPDEKTKYELYVMTIAGTHLTRLTGEPDIEWQGPLSWSADGRWIAMAGRRMAEGGDLWEYLVPVGSDAQERGRLVSLPQSRGTTGWARFSSAQPLLAVQVADGGILVYDLSDGWSAVPTVEDTGLLGLQVGMDGAFDWAMGGNSLLYLAKGVGGTQIRISRTIGIYSRDTAEQTGEQLSELAVPQLESLSFQPGGMLISTLQDEHSTGCRMVQFYDVFLYDKTHVTPVPGLCVTGRLEHESWTPRGQPQSTTRWLVVEGRPEQGGEKDGLYAVVVPAPLAPARPELYVRLADLPLTSGTVPLVRPVHASLNIQPQPAFARDPASPLAAAPVGLPGNLLAVEKPPSGLSVAGLWQMHPDGSQQRLVVPADGSMDCPAWSPDRTMVAFTSDRSFQELVADSDHGQKRGPDEIFVIDAAGTGRISQLTHPIFGFTDLPDLVQRYTCPVWSPDSKYLATVSTNGQGAGVQVMDISGRLLRYVPSGLPSRTAGLVWAPDGESLLLAEPAMRGSPATIVRVPWRLPVASNTIVSLEGWDDIQGLALSPDGQQLAVILVRFAAEDHAAEAILRVYRLPGMTRIYQHALLGYDPRMIHGEGHISWLPEDDLVVLIPGSPLGQYKGILTRFIPTEDIIQDIVLSGDEIYDWTLNGAWLVYASESGLWGMPLNGRFDARVSSLLLTKEMFQRLSWR